MDFGKLKRRLARPLAAVKGIKVDDFVKVALGDFTHVAAIFPSSPWATRSVVRNIPAAARAIVEYGPGGGAVTRQILRRLARDARLVAIELNTQFVTDLKGLQAEDARLEIHHGDVQEMSSRLRDLVPHGADAVISGIPFSFLSHEQRQEIVRNTRSGLSDGGRFIVYQNSPKMCEYLKPYFSDVKCRFEPRNVFPYFIMVATA